MTTNFPNNLADSSLSRVLITPETTWGGPTTIEDNALSRVLPFTSESLTYTPTTIASSTITQRRTQTDLILANLQAEGDIDAEFTEGNFDGLLKAALLSSGSTGAETNALTWEYGEPTDVITLTGGARFNTVDGRGEILVYDDDTLIRESLVDLPAGQIITVAGAVEDPTPDRGGSSNGIYTLVSSTEETAGVLLVLEEPIIAADNEERDTPLEDVADGTIITISLPTSNIIPLDDGESIFTNVAETNTTSAYGTISFTQANIRGGHIRDALDAFIRGQAITIKGATQGLNNANGTYTVLSANAVGNDGVIIKLLETFKGISGVGSVTIMGTGVTFTTQRIADGNAVDSVNRQSFTVEKQLRLGGTADKYFLYRGMMVGSLTFSVSAQELATISVSFLGKDSNAYESDDAEFAAINTRLNATGVTLEQTKLPAFSNDLDNASVNGSDDFNGIYQADELQALVSSFSITINNNLRAQNALGTVGAIGVGVGTSEITGTVDIFLKDLSMYKKFIANDTSSLQFRFTALDAAGASQTYQIYLPKIKFSNVEQPISSNNADVVTTGTFQALHDTDSNASIVISKA